MKKFFRKASHFLEYILFLIITGLLRLMSIDTSASLCAFVAKKIGGLFAVTNTARLNIRRAIGVLPIKKEDKIIEDLWDNFGRFIGEFPHIHSLTQQDIDRRVEIVGMEHIRGFQEQKRPFIIMTGHFANWDFILRITEMLYPQFGIVYRKANNPFVDKLVSKWRARGDVNLIAKGHGGARSLVKSIKAKNAIAMLVDQKMNDGIDVPFFGSMAKTAPAIAKLALQFDYPIVPLQIVRTNGTHFKAILHPHLSINSTGDESQDIFEIMKNVNEILEDWIREKPSQWLWFHNRWEN